ncbi:FAD-binding oxidoreductase [Albidovulum sediminis]|uniref:FAD-binding oxidoreductase n=1 Tax=Albidovulum sediminis TaxID=3066345 RepID=A0ABT2NGB3_9RHOB|nr:FAD-binding oxidoreductase [Defluviimonas sediminis]MCT8327952.1 FAD-binding oxidoreductase [Defluviimonas sediminis]
MNIEKLKAAVKGAVIPVFDPSFKASTEALLWNGRKQSAQPQLIVKASCIPDVIATVRFAAEAGLRVSPRGGGHNFSGIAQQDGIVLDLGALNRIWIDRSARIAEVGPAATNADLASALEAQGLAFPVGHCASVPMSGYLLGGGFGWNSGSWGYGFSNVESIDVVLADGVLRRVSETEHAEIFWAARGAGPEFFGVVVGYRLRLKPLPRAITTVVRVYPLTAVKGVVAWMKAAMDVVPNFVEFTAAMQSAPGSDGSAKVLLAIATVFADDPAEASAIHGRIAALAPEGAFDVQPEMPTPIGVLYEIIGQFFPVGHRYAVDSAWSADGAEDYVAGLAEGIAAAPSAQSFALATVLSPSRPTPPDAAFSMFGPVWGCVYTIWEKPEDDAENLAWLRRTTDGVASSVLGHYVGEADLERPERRNACHAPAALEKLRAMQKRYDPQGIFLRAVPAATPAKGAQAA